MHPIIARAAMIMPSSSASEADNEESLVDDSPRVTQGGNRCLMERGAPHFPAEDTRLTSKKELAGWYSYGWASEVFVVCGISSFIPITLEQLARERGVLLSDRTTPCSTGLSVSQSANSTFTNLAPAAAAAGQCVVSILGMEINTASFAMYTFSLSVLVQFVVIISISGAADHGRYRKTLLLSFALIGAIATMLFLPMVPQVYVLAALLAIIANTSFGASFVLLNSFLPLFVRYHPSVRHAFQTTSHDIPALIVDHNASDQPVTEEYSVTEDIADSTAALLPSISPRQSRRKRGSYAAISTSLEVSTKISSYGIGIGYLAAVSVQALAIVIVVFTSKYTESSTLPLRLVLFLIGFWWLIFTIPAALWLRPRPGPPLQAGSGIGRGRLGTYIAYIIYSWRSLGRTILRARRLRDVMLFLGAWFMLSDGIATVSGTAVLFAKTSLGMKTEALAFINVISTLSGVVGAFTWATLSRSMGLTPSQTILACLGLFEIIPIYGLLGYLPAIKRLGVFGLQQQWEMYPLGALYGFVLGGFSSFCRSLFGELIPPGSEAAFYALYSITDKGSSVFGPAIVGAITQASGEIRPAFWFLAVLIGLPFPLFWLVDVERGKREGAALSKAIAGREALEN